jgi:hypothetical protein
VNEAKAWTQAVSENVKYALKLFQKTNSYHVTPTCQILGEEKKRM